MQNSVCDNDAHITLAEYLETEAMALRIRPKQAPNPDALGNELIWSEVESTCNNSTDSIGLLGAHVTAPRGNVRAQDESHILCLVFIRN
jgi:hypothetical protein